MWCGLHPGAGSGELPAPHTAALLGAAAGPVPGGAGPGGGAERGARRPGYAEGAPRPAAQHQDEAGARDQNLPKAPGQRGGQVSARERPVCSHSSYWFDRGSAEEPNRPHCF